MRAPLLLWLAYVAMRHVADPLYTSLFGSLNLGLHEGGHLLFGYLPGDFLAVAGGTLELDHGAVAPQRLDHPDRHDTSSYRLRSCVRHQSTNVPTRRGLLLGSIIQKFRERDATDGQHVGG